MFRRYLTQALATITLSTSVQADSLDNFIHKFAIDEKNAEWRDHFTLSFLETSGNVAFLREAGHKKPRKLAALTRLAEIGAHQLIYTPFIENKRTPTYAAADIVGTYAALTLTPLIEERIDFSKLTKKPSKGDLIFLGTLTGLSYMFSHRKDPLDLNLHAEEKIDNTTKSHLFFFTYYTLRTSQQARRTNSSYPLEKAAWRAFYLGAAKEVIFDTGWGTGPSLLDLTADATGIYLGYRLSKFIEKKLQ